MYGSPASMKRARTIAPPRKSSVNEQAYMATLPSMRDSHATMRVDTQENDVTGLPKITTQLSPEPVKWKTQATLSYDSPI